MAVSDAGFPIGTKFMSGGKHSRLCTVVDIWRTYNAAGELVRVRYVSTREFAGQLVTDYDIPEISPRMRGLASL
jgi:hypothetical protein